MAFQKSFVHRRAVSPTRRRPAPRLLPNTRLGTRSGTLRPAGFYRQKAQPAGLWPPAWPRFARVWACATTPDALGTTRLYGFVRFLRMATHPYRTRTRSDDQPAWTMASRVSVGAAGGTATIAHAAKAAGNDPRTRRMPGSCSYTSLARALGCTGVYGSCPGQSPIRDKDASDSPAPFDRPNPRSPEGWKGAAPRFACRKRPDSGAGPRASAAG